MRVLKISDNIEARKSGVCPGKGVFARGTISSGEMLIDIEARIVKRFADYTLQTGKSSYLRANYIDNFINHSCSPNVFIRLYRGNKKRVYFIALKTIRRGKELFWNYNTTEWDFGRGFACHCGQKNCVGRVRGMKYLTKAQQKKLSSIATPYIRQRLAEQHKA